MKPNKKELKNHCIIIPLHLPFSFPSDYAYQTGKELAKNNKVIFFDFKYPVSWKSLFDFKKNKDTPKIMRDLFQKKRGWIYFRPLSIFPFQHINFIYNANVFLGIIQLKILLFFSKLPIITWIFSPIAKSVLGKLGEKISVYDCNDYYSDEKSLIDRVNYVFFNSKELMQQKVSEYPEIKDKSNFVVCGCNTALFQKKILKKDGKQTNILLIGQLNYRIDFSLLYYLVNKNPLFNFIIIGPIYEESFQDFQKISKLPNVKYLGEKNKSDIPTYFHLSHIGIIPYDVSFRSAKYCNPMKAYEYMASGLPVIATPIGPLEHFPKDIVYTTDNKEEFSQTIIKLIKGWDNKKRKIAKSIAEKNNWENKLKSIGKIITNNEKAN